MHQNVKCRNQYLQYLHLDSFEIIQLLPLLWLYGKRNTFYANFNDLIKKVKHVLLTGFA